MIKNMSIKKKLVGILLVPLFVFMVVNVLLIQKNNRDLNQMENVLYEITGKATSLILNADRDMYQALVAYQLIVSGALNKELLDTQMNDLKENVDQANERVGNAELILSENDLLQLIHEESKLTPQQNFNDYKQFFSKWVTDANANVSNKSAPVYSQELMDGFLKARQGLNEIGESLDVYTLNQTSQIRTENQELQILLYTLIGIFALIILSLGYLIIRQITKTVAQILAKTQRVSEGDLQIDPNPIYYNDELGNISLSIDNMINQLRGLLQDILKSSSEVQSSSEKLSFISKNSSAAANNVAIDIGEVTKGIDVQARSSQKTSQAIEEMATGIQKIAEATSLVAELSMNTESNAEQGSHLLGKMKIQMSNILSSIRQLSDMVSSLNQSSQNIGMIVDNINTFAMSTNLLSLNASIEAARAGEHGRGFTVVANEIRKLASQSAASAENIAQLTEETRKEIEQASHFMERSVQEVNEGSLIMVEVNSAFDQILIDVKSMSLEMHGTSAISEQMSASSEEVSIMMGESVRASRETFGKTESVTASTEEQLADIQTIAQSAEQMIKVVSALNRSVAYFKF